MSEDRILFVIPPYFNIDDYSNDSHSSVLPPFTIPYGILSLDAYLKAKSTRSVVVSILDLNLLLRKAIDEGKVAGFEELFSYSLKHAIDNFNPTIVGISALFNISFRYINRLADLVKKESPECLVIAGGGLPSAAFRQVLEMCPSVDAVCKGEGEIPMTDFVDAEDKNLLLDSHPSWITRQALAQGKIPGHTFVQDLDEIPMLSYEGIDLEDYNNRSIDKRYVGQKKREMAIHTSRGCPFLCVFCSNPSLHGRKVRAMSVARVVHEVKMMKDRYGLTVLLIEDDHFFFNQERAKQILSDLIPLAIRIEFPNGVAVYGIDEQVAELFSKAGVSTVALAVESGSDYVLNKIIKKPLKVNMVKKKVEMLRQYDIQCHVFIVIGLPREMKEHRQETLDLLLDVGFDWAHIFCVVPIFGSRLHEICVENGYIDKTDFLDHVNTKSVIRAPGVDPENIERTAYQINLLVNFVHNYNLKIGNYETAAKYFLNVVSKYPEHAFGYYALAKAYQGIGRTTEANEFRCRFESIIADDPYWLDQAERCGLLEGPGYSAMDTLRVA